MGARRLSALRVRKSPSSDRLRGGNSQDPAVCHARGRSRRAVRVPTAIICPSCDEHSRAAMGRGPAWRGPCIAHCEPGIL
jgi:hypothetical protein